MVGILGVSILSAISMGFLVRFVDGKKVKDTSSLVLDGAARRERRGQRGIAGFGKGRK